MKTKGKVSVKRNELKLKIVSKDLSTNPITHTLTNAIGDLSVKIYTYKEHQGDKKNLPFLLSDLWNNYIELSVVHKTTPALFFKKFLSVVSNLNVKTAEIQFMEAELNLITEQRNDARLWNKIYRNSLVIIICG